MRNTIIILFLLAFYNVVGAESTLKIMPNELLKIAAKCNCEQVDDFYNRPGMIEPPYVYGFLPGEQENSAVFWCREKNEDKKYLLVLASRKSFFDDWSYKIIIKTSKESCPVRPIPAYKAGLYGLTENRQLSESNSKPPFIPVHRTGHSGNFSNYPRGLSIVKNCNISLDNFFYISNPRKRGPKGVFPSSDVILSTYDGVSEYYNHKGSWLISVWH